MKTKILYEDRDIIVCHKPAGIAVQSAGIGSIDMVSELKRYIKQSLNLNQPRDLSGKEPYLGIVHRLDQPVEGVLVFAKTRSAAAELSKQAAAPKPIIYSERIKAASECISYPEQTKAPSECISDSEQIKVPSDKFMKKIYHAEVYGHLPKMAGELENELIKDSATNTSHIVNRSNIEIKKSIEVLSNDEVKMPLEVTSNNGIKKPIELPSNDDKRERTENIPNHRNHKSSGGNQKESPQWAYLTYKVLERKNETDLLEVRLFTGRHHQIRAQFSHAGYPLVGDAKYASAESAEYNQKQNIRAVSLRAVRLEFTHPRNGKRMVFSIS